MRKLVFGACLTLAFSTWVAPRCDAQDQATPARGEAIAQANCSRCHAVGRSGDSPNAEAPAFRTLSQRYPVDNLEEALAEGISVGHPAMPEFQFEPNDAHALVLYLQSIQDSAPAHNGDRR